MNSLVSFRMLSGSVVRLAISVVFCFFKQKTAYEMRISDWSSDVCSSDLGVVEGAVADPALAAWQVGEDRMRIVRAADAPDASGAAALADARWVMREAGSGTRAVLEADRKSTRLNSSH